MTAAIRLGPPRAPLCEPVLRGTTATVDAGVFSVDELPCNDDAPLEVSVTVGRDGYGVTANGATLGLGCESLGPGPAVREHDRSALVACLSRIQHLHSEFRSSRAVTLRAAPAARFDEVAPTLVAVRTDASGAPLFPDVTLAIAR